jgi:hypothetical protein
VDFQHLTHVTSDDNLQINNTASASPKQTMSVGQLEATQLAEACNRPGSDSLKVHARSSTLLLGLHELDDDEALV